MDNERIRKNVLFTSRFWRHVRRFSLTECRHGVTKTSPPPRVAPRGPGIADE